MKTIRTFVSFSSKDYAVVRRLLARLKVQQPLSLWDYSCEGEEIPGGVDITPFLTKQIDDSNLFIPVVTSNSHGSQYTRAEVAHALNCRESGRLKIIPLVDREFINHPCFRVDEFRENMTINGLCFALSRDKYKLHSQSPINTVEWLNETLILSDLYEQITRKKIDKKVSDSLGKCKSRYDETKGGDRLKVLNRALLEEFYRQETPQIQNRVWEEPFNRLRSLRYYEVDFSSKKDMEAAIYRICLDMDIPYMPLPVEDSRLPFMQKFEDELAREVPAHSERTNSIHCRLHHALINFTVSFESGDYRQAANAMGFFISTCEYEFPKKKFYYSYIVKAVCLMSMGDWAEAQEILFALLRHEGVDENAFGALGYIKQHQGCYEEAASFYMEALRRDSKDPAAASGVLINNVLCGNLQAIEEYLAIMENGASEQPVRDRIKIDKVKAHALAAIGRSLEAGAIWLRLVAEGAAEPADAINLSRVLVDLNRHEDGIRILETFHTNYPESLELLHQLATLYWLVGRQKDAVHHFESLIEKSPNNFQYRYDHLYSLWKSGQKEPACTAAQQFLHIGLPNGTDDFFRIGFANWVLGHEERSLYDFERSGKPESEFYRYFVK